MMKSKIVVYLFIACLYLLFHAPLFNWWCDTGIGRLLAGVNSSCLNDTIAFLLVILGCGVAVEIPDGLSGKGNKWGRMIAGCTILIIATNSIAFNESFVHFKTISWLRYTDVLFPMAATFMIASWAKARKVGRKALESHQYENLLLYDDCAEVDFLGRTKRVESICDFIKKNGGNRAGATGIAITGGWGTGKSWMLEQIRKRMAAEDVICVDFRPWVYGDKDIPRQFYLALEHELKVRGIEIKELKDAVLEIDNDEIVGIGRVLLSFVGIMTKSQGRAKAIDNIKRELRNRGQQICVFIDDCDRLGHDELLQVLSLIRNTGDFPMLSYIMAFDDGVVRKVLKEEDGIHYVAKMFNLTEVLPPITDDVIAGYLNAAARGIMKVKEDMVNPFSKVPITNYLPTVREAKKYLNLLRADYLRLQERFERYTVNEGDFCLVELLKYMYPDLYYSVKSNPRKYLDYVREGWNSPAAVPQKSVEGVDEAQMRLMKSIFKIVDSPSDYNGMIGVANEDYFNIYFEDEMESRYVESSAFVDAVNKRVFPDRLGEWMREGCVGVLELIGASHQWLTRKDVFLSMAVYLWHQCDKDDSIHSLSQLTYGYDKDNKRHSYRSIKDVIGQTPQIHLLTFQHLTAWDDPDEKDGEDSMDALIRESPYAMELMGIWQAEMRETTNTDYPYGEVRFYIEALWKRLISELKDDSLSTLNIIEILADCTMEDTFENMVLPLVKDDPRRWLGGTILRLKDDDKEYFLLKTHGIHAIFGSLGMMYDEMKRIVSEAKDDDKDYVNAYADLLFRLAAMTVNKSDSTIDDKYKIPECIQVEQLKALEESKRIGVDPVMPIEAAISQMAETAFWKGENLRMHRDDPGYYFGTEI